MDSIFPLDRSDTLVRGVSPEDQWRGGGVIVEIATDQPRLPTHTLAAEKIGDMPRSTLDIQSVIWDMEERAAEYVARNPLDDGAKVFLVLRGYRESCVLSTLLLEDMGRWGEGPPESFRDNRKTHEPDRELWWAYQYDDDEFYRQVRELGGAPMVDELWGSAPELIGREETEIVTIYRGISLRPGDDPLRAEREDARGGLGSSWTLNLDVAKAITERGKAGFSTSDYVGDAWPADQRGPNMIGEDFIPTVIRAEVELLVRPGDQDPALYYPFGGHYGFEEEVDVPSGTEITLTGWMQAERVWLDSAREWFRFEWPNWFTDVNVRRTASAGITETWNVMRGGYDPEGVSEGSDGRHAVPLVHGEDPEYLWRVVSGPEWDDALRSGIMRARGSGIFAALRPDLRYLDGPTPGQRVVQLRYDLSDGWNVSWTGDQIDVFTLHDIPLDRVVAVTPPGNARDIRSHASRHSRRVEAGRVDTGHPEIDDLIEEFLDERSPWGGSMRDLRDPSVAHGYCHEISEQFVEFARSRGFDRVYAENATLDELGYQTQGEPQGEVLDEDGNIVPGFYDEHTIVSFYVDGSVVPINVDFTAAQYGYTEFPKVLASRRQALLERRWREWGEHGNRGHITAEDHGTLPIEVVENMLGASGERPGEHLKYKGEKWEDFKADIAERGILSPIFITVFPGESPRISEGNHRRDAAVELGMTEVPVQVRYWGRAEEMNLTEYRIDDGRTATRRTAFHQVTVSVMENRLLDDGKAGRLLTTDDQIADYLSAILSAEGYPFPVVTKPEIDPDDEQVIVLEDPWGTLGGSGSDSHNRAAVARAEIQMHGTGEKREVGAWFLYASDGLPELYVLHEAAHLIDQSGRGWDAVEASPHDDAWLGIYQDLLDRWLPEASALLSFGSA